MASAPPEQIAIDAPYVASPPHIVDAMLKLAKVRSGDIVSDLGCGDFGTTFQICLTSSYTLLDYIGMQSLHLASIADDAKVFRQFNRTYTKLIGTLEEGMLKTEYSLAEARVLYEMATREKPTAKEIAEALGMDQGYLSRLLSRFEDAGLIRRKVSKQDNRAAHLILTRSGSAAFATLNARSEEQARRLLDRLLPTDRAQLVEAMKTIESLLADDSGRVPPCVLRPHRPGDMGWILHREAMVYRQEYGWDETFEALVAQIVTDFMTHFDSKRERCWIAEIDGDAVGHIFLVQHPDEPGTAKLRLLLVEASARGRGVGQALVNECIRFARACGYRKITLWTQSILTAAHQIYQRAGFRMVAEAPHHSFGKDLNGQTWELDLTPGQHSKV